MRTLPVAAIPTKARVNITPDAETKLEVTVLGIFHSTPEPGKISWRVAETPRLLEFGAAYKVEVLELP